jgi:hypothetical protein
VDPPLLEWATASCPIPGEEESGDLPLVHPYPNGALVAAVDGLGHGAEAARAARLAVAILSANATEPVISLCLRCHERLKRTRGAVFSLASFDARLGRMSWVGVGNVEGVLLRADPAARRETVLLHPGVIGYQLPHLGASDVAVSPGDTLVFATDGIDSSFTDCLTVDDSPRNLADNIRTRYTKGTDDALVLVARYLGGPER